MNVSRSLTLLWTPLGIAAGIALVAVTAVLSFVAWRRSGFARGTGMIEALRLTIVTLVAITLNQPEVLQTFLPEERATLAVLWDESRSMETKDVVSDNRSLDAAVSRRESIQALLDEEFWSPVAGELDVVIESFSSSLDQPTEGTDLGGTLAAAAKKHANLRGIVVLSDGDWNIGEPPIRAATDLRMKNIPVFGVGVGSESRLPDIELAAVQAPTFGVVGKPMRIPFVIESALPRDYDTTITLTPSRGDPITKDIRIPAMGRLEDAVTWTPAEVGDYRLSVRIPPQSMELSEENNYRNVPIAIREEALSVLLVESYPRWEYRYLRNALQRDPGVEVRCLLFHPELSKVGGGRDYIQAFPDTMEQLSKFDVVFLGDVGVGEGQLTDEQCRLIKGLVQSQASGLILMPGLRGRQFSLLGTELDELYPVVLEAAQPRGWGSRVPSRFALTETGRRSLLTKLEDDDDLNVRVWDSLPGFQWYAPVLRAKAGSQVLAIHRSESNRFGRVPLLVTKTYGTGKVLFMGTDGAWRWREGVEDKYHYRFWGQVARWMAYQRNIAQGEGMRLFFSPDRPKTQDLVTLYANVMSAGGEPLQQGTVIVQIVSPEGSTQSVRLAPAGDQWGLFTGTFVPKEAGQYGLTLTCRENRSTLKATLSVQGVAREKLGQPARLGVLEEIAEVTRGKSLTSGDLEGLLGHLATLPEPEPIVRRLRIWCHPLWAGLLVGLLGAFWVGRKLIGTI